MTTKEKVISFLKENQGTIELTTNELSKKLSVQKNNLRKHLKRLANNGTIFYTSTRGRNGKLTITFQNNDTICQGDTISNDTIYQDGNADSLKEDTLKEDTLKEDSLKEDTLKEDTLKEDSLKEDTLKEDTLKEDSQMTGEVIDDDVVLNKILNYVEEVKLDIRNEYEDRIKSLEEEISQHLSYIKKICSVVHKLEAQMNCQSIIQQECRNTGRNSRNVTSTIRFNYLKEILEDPNKEWHDKKEASEELKSLIGSHTLTEKQQPYAESILENYKKEHFKEELTERAKEFNKLRKFIGSLPREELKNYKKEAEKLLSEREYFYNLAKKKRLPVGLIDPALLSLGVEAYEKAISLQNHELQKVKKTWLNEISKKENASTIINIEDAKTALYKIVIPINGTSEEKTEIIYKIVNAMEAHNKECQKACVKVC